MKKNFWILKIFLFTFFITLIVSGITSYISVNCNLVFIVIITLIIILIGILFDMIGTSVLTANEANFHAMAANKIKGSKESIKLIKNNRNIASFCNDVIGDICGVISGSTGTIIALYISSHFQVNISLAALIVASTISSLTVGGKAIGKEQAIKNSDKILSLVGKFLNHFHKN